MQEIPYAIPEVSSYEIRHSSSIDREFDLTPEPDAMDSRSDVTPYLPFSSYSFILDLRSARVFCCARSIEIRMVSNGKGLKERYRPRQ